MKYFYDYFVREYRADRKDKQFSVSVDMLRGINSEDVQRCRKILKTSFACYREGRNTEILKRLLGEYREYVAECYDPNSKVWFNAFVYRYMMEIHVGSRAIAASMGVTKETVLNYINRSIDEMLMLCMGMPVNELPKENEAVIGTLIGGSGIFHSMAGEYILQLFTGRRERTTIELGRKCTKDIMETFANAVAAYFRYCNDDHARIDTDIRKAEILQKCIAGIPPAAIAEEYGCCPSTVYADIRENEKRLAAMLFGTGKLSWSRGND